MDIKELSTVPTLSNSQALRLRAESASSGKVVATAESLQAMTPGMVLRLLHELQVHQIELEMQNEELRKTQSKLEVMRARYFDLYDLAPISYCTVSKTGVIIEANLATAQLLGETRSHLVGRRISSYISKGYQDVFYLCRKLLLARGEQQGCELYLNRADGVAVWVYLNISTAQDSNGDAVLRLVLTDITVAKTLALAMQESESRLRGLLSSHA